MTKGGKFLDQVYEEAADTRAIYQDWAETYDREIAENGYATPRRCAAALVSFQADLALPVLDIGCGTGLSGVALREAGFSVIDGCDPSPEMLAEAAARKGLYRDLWRIEQDAPLAFPADDYAQAAAMGVLAAGHAPPSLIDEVLGQLPADGLFTFSLNDHTLQQEPAYEARIAENVDTGYARLLFKEHGPHLPGIDLEANVYVMQKS